MNDKPKTFVILTPGFAKDEADSTCIPTQQNFVRALKEIYPQLNIIILAFDYPYVKKRYQWFNNTVVSFNGRNKGGFLKLLLRRKIFSALSEIHASNNIVGLLSFWYVEGALIGKKFADKNGLKHICWICGQDAKKGNKYVQRIPLKAGELAALSDFLQDEFEKNYGTRPHYVIPPGINTKQFSKSIRQRDIDILAAGSLIPLKQYEIFIDVIAALKKQMPGVNAVLIGDGPEKNKLEALVKMNELQSNILLAGELPHAEVLHTMQRAKVFLHPSSYEGFVIAGIEALCAGTEVISFVKPMHTEIENWHTVKNKEEMIRKTISILQDQTKEYNSTVPYTIEETVKKMGALFSL